VMELAARVLGADPAVVPKLLERVGLSEDAGERRIGGYSLGMRQRLGLAHALIGDPSVLVLDEPANGLDPEGIHWMRYLLREFAEGGGTVLLSSHLLREVEAVADRLVVIAGGRVLVEGTRDELLAGTGTRVRAADPGLLRQALDRAGIEATSTSDGAFLTQADAAAVGMAAAAVGVPLLELRPADEDGLERLFLSLTGANGSEIA
jgi:ABC-2 type transport system ATP-binding protein